MAIIGAMVAALALTGCGRKGPLDLPPAAAISEPGVGEPKQASVGPDGKPVAPRTGPNRPTILDWLVE